MTPYLISAYMAVGFWAAQRYCRKPDSVRLEWVCEFLFWPFGLAVMWLLEPTVKDKKDA